MEDRQTGGEIPNGRRRYRRWQSGVTKLVLGRSSLPMSIWSKHWHMSRTEKYFLPLKEARMSSVRGERLLRGADVLVDGAAIAVQAPGDTHDAQPIFTPSRRLSTGTMRQAVRDAVAELDAQGFTPGRRARQHGMLEHPDRHGAQSLGNLAPVLRLSLHQRTRPYPAAGLSRTDDILAQKSFCRVAA
ncbi:hypothetical protein Emag_007792 [Eimeria magna]